MEGEKETRRRPTVVGLPIRRGNRPSAPLNEGRARARLAKEEKGETAGEKSDEGMMIAVVEEDEKRLEGVKEFGPTSIPSSTLLSSCSIPIAARDWRD